MTVEQNVRTIRRMVDDAVNADRSDLLEQFVHPGVRVHPGTPGAAPDTVGVDELAAAFRGFHTTFPDLHVRIEDVVADEDRVAARWVASGTHSAELAGIAATGRTVTWGGTDVYRLVDGKVVEWWRNDDTAWLLDQLRRPVAGTPGRG